MTMPYAEAWNTWYDATDNAPSGVAALRDIVDSACRDVGRDPATVRRTAAVLVRFPGGTGRIQGNEAQPRYGPLEGPPAVLADAFRAYAAAGLDDVQLVVDPITLDSIRALAPVLMELERA